MWSKVNHGDNKPQSGQNPVGMLSKWQSLREPSFNHEIQAFNLCIGGATSISDYLAVFSRIVSRGHVSGRRDWLSVDPNTRMAFHL